jgi:acetoin utilization deacetylase AcuC-like enzyme
MKILYDPTIREHDTGVHPESNRRLSFFKNLVPEPNPLDGAPYLELVHPKNYIDKVRRHCEQNKPLDGDTQTSPGSFGAACAAVGATILAMERGDFALVRPPGHHAYRDKASGFCLFNNIAIAAQKAVNEGKRVLILDFDGHLGDGTMDIFYDSDRVLFWSLHQYPAFPGHGSAHEIGVGPGKGFTINVPLPPSSGDDILMHAVDYLLPVVLRFQPDVVAVSAGFDAHQFDPLLQLRASAGFYYKIGALLTTHFPGKLFAVLEGGYNAEELPRCVDNFIAGVNGEPMPHAEASTTSGLRIWETYEMQLHTVAGLLSKYWKF